MHATIAGFDTGILWVLLTDPDRGQRIVDILEHQEQAPVLSILSIAEFYRIGFRQGVQKKKLTDFLDTISLIFHIVSLEDIALAQRAAATSHSLQIPLMDALILESLIHGGATEIYTTDRDLLRASKRGLQIHIM